MRNLKSYIRYMRKQSKHVQHIHAFIFAGTITLLVAIAILYTSYGLWHVKYRATGDLMVEGEVITTPPVEPESPGEMLSRFWGEARTQFSSIGTSGASLLEGKETYVK